MIGIGSSILHEAQLDKWQASNGKQNSIIYGDKMLLFSTETIYNSLVLSSDIGSLFQFFYSNIPQVASNEFIDSRLVALRNKPN